MHFYSATYREAYYLALSVLNSQRIELNRLVNEVVIGDLIEQQLEENPFLLLDINCNQIQNWQSLAQHTAPQNVQDKINNLPNSLTNNFEIQALSDA